MKKFLDDNFLLNNETAVRLFNDYAKDMPIIDYHCHLSPQEIYENKRFKNITDAWLYGDHYKWRVMRACGFEESLVTGPADDYDRFMAWAKTVPQTIGNPLYHWTHLELQRFFGIYDLVNEKTAPSIWERVNAQLAGDGFGARDLIKKSNVKVICTTDDPTDSMEWHIKIKELKDFDTKILPSFRPDKGLEINQGTFLPWIEKLGEVAGGKIGSYDQLLAAIESRINFFHSIGGRLSDHALNYVPYAEATKDEVAAIFAKALSGQKVSHEEETKYKTAVLIFLGKQYAKNGWTMQYHINANRNNNSRLVKKLGPDTGLDSMNDNDVAKPLTGLLDAMESEDLLPRTILYSNNPKDHYVLATLAGSFQGGGIPGKMQLGAAWWFLDTKNGMLEQMDVLANVGLLSRFVGMLTDSRSFLSYPRHEYFRRILCNMLGQWVEEGEVPNDLELLGGMVQDISYRNAQNYFNFA